MNRHLVICDDMSFGQAKKELKKPQTHIEKELTLDDIIKISKDKKTIRSNRKRKEYTKELFLEYLDFHYNNDDDFM